MAVSTSPNQPDARSNQPSPTDDSPAPPPLAILTGATGGIGSALAPRLAHRGYRVALLGRAHDTLHRLEQQLGPHRAVAIPIDLLDSPRLQARVRDLLTTHGPAEALINNAGANRYATFLDQTQTEHRQSIELNYLAPAALIRMVLPDMLARDRGWVINVTSMSARIGPWGHAGYAGAKAALTSLTETLAAEHARTNVHFCAVSPSIVRTNFFAHPDARTLWNRIRRHAINPDHVAARIEQLLDRPQTEICIPRHHSLLDWLSALAPETARKLVARQSRPAE